MKYLLIALLLALPGFRPLGTGCSVSYSTNALSGGSIGFFFVSGATPGGIVLIGYSTRGAGPTNTAYGQVAMSLPIYVLATLNADGVGDITYTPFVPSSASGHTLYSQCVDISSGCLSNPIAQPIL